MYTQSPQDEDVHITQTTSGLGICAITTPSGKQKVSPLVSQVHNSIKPHNIAYILSSELTPCYITKLNTTSQSCRICYITSK